MASGCCPTPSHYDELTLQTWVKLDQSFKLLLVRHLVTGKGNQPIKPAPKSALFSSSSHTLMSDNTIHSSSCVDIDCSISILVSYASSLRPHCLWPLCLIHFGQLLPSCENSLLPKVFMAVNAWFSLHHYRWLLPVSSVHILDIFQGICLSPPSALHCPSHVTHKLITVWRSLFEILMSVPNFQMNTEFIFSPESDFLIPITQSIHLLKK